VCVCVRARARACVRACACVCVCNQVDGVLSSPFVEVRLFSTANTQDTEVIYIYICMFLHICVCVCSQLIHVVIFNIIIL